MQDRGLATMLSHMPLLVGLTCLLLSPGVALPAEPVAERGKLTLDECIRTALKNQPALQARQAGVGVAAEQQKVARSYFFPQAGVATTFTQLDRHVFVVASGLTGPSADLFTDAGGQPSCGPSGSAGCTARRRRSREVRCVYQKQSSLILAGAARPLFGRAGQGDR
jgi:hypothetical protein